MLEHCSPEGLWLFFCRVTDSQDGTPADSSLDGLTTPVRPKAKQTPTSRLASNSANGNQHANGSPSSSFTPTSNGNAFATPSRPSPMGNGHGPSGSSYRPGPSKLAPPTSTPIGRSAPSSPTSAMDSPSLYVTDCAATPFFIFALMN